MEVLLLQDIHGIGKQNDLIVVGDGYALNALLPKKQALVATPAVRKRYAEDIRKRAEERQKEHDQQRATAASLSGKEVKIENKVSEKGKLYSAVTNKEIADALHNQHNIVLDEKSVALHDPIKELGTHDVKVKFDVATEIVKVHVIAEGVNKEEAKKKEDKELDEVSV